ncbi:MAG: magnesium transporter [Alphaproteobacteria bacterium CG11_big_fil_rev_8_21_14_0_20_44_7]|nr:MAG: magnesium transporter [Alphaproteobacteria bacterium CG11_big_fil_rev_8_21_14_0_20_44_7]
MNNLEIIQASGMEDKSTEFQGENIDSDAIVSEISEALSQLDVNKTRELVTELHPADFADVIENLDHSERKKFLEIIKDDFDPEIFSELEPELLEEVTDLIGRDASAEALSKLDSDVVIEIVEELDEKEQQEIIEALPEENRAEVQAGLSYPEDSVGRLMSKKFVTVPEYWNVGQVIDYLRNQDDLPNDFHVIYVVDPKHRPVQYVLVSRIMRNKRDIKITDISEPCKHLVSPHDDQEEAAYLFRQYGLVSLAAVNEKGRMIGVLTTSDIVEVIEEEHEEDIMRLGGVTSRDFYSAVQKTVFRRFPWLFINMVNAFFAAIIIMHYAESIEAVVALAALSPIVAAVVGNSGAQTLTVSVRAIAKRDITPRNAPRVVFKEMFIGLVNGTMIGALASAVVYAYFRDTNLSLVFGISIMACFAAAGIIGSFIPIMLNKFKIDPAIASSAFVIALTDILSFFVFLGLATSFLINA